MALAAAAALWAVLVYGEADRMASDDWAARCEQRLRGMFRRRHVAPAPVSVGH